MTAVYIAGPMRGIPYFNFDAFYEAEGAVLDRLIIGSEVVKMEGTDTPGESVAADVTIFNPARRDHDVHGSRVNDSPTGDLADIDKVFDLRDALATDLDWIARKATHIFMLRGWENSSGATAELALAKALGLTVLYEDEAMTLSQTGEVRTTSLTGGEKGTKVARYDLIPARPLNTLASLYGKGAEKYADRNWERGYEWSKSFAALNRHLWAFWSGEDTDPEHGLPHLASVAWHAFALMEWATTHPEYDDRPVS